MSFALLMGLTALLAFIGLAALRIVRVHYHREGPSGWWKVAFVVGYLLVPPLVLQAIAAPKSGAVAVDPINAVLLYIPAVVTIWLLAQAAAFVVARVAPIKWRPILLLALIGRDSSGMIAFDPPMTPALAADVERVDALNAAFPRGSAFIGQVSTPGFRTSWDALDSATLALEGDIAEQRRLRLGVSERAIDTANDARGRLDTLKRVAVEGGLVWAV